MPTKKPASARKSQQARDAKQLRASSRDLLGAEQGREPTSEEREPPVYEQGLNDGPNIAESIDVELIDDNLYRSKSLWVPARARGVFGGQVIGQAVSASNATVRDDVFLHSLHCYFLLAGDKTVPIIYDVKRLRDGGSYVTRSVEAIQHGRAIFTIMLSYQRPEPGRPRFAIPLPRSLGPAGDADGVDAGGMGNSSLLLGGASKGPSPESVFSANRSANGDVMGLFSPEESPLNEERYLRVLREKGHMMDAGLRKVLEGWVEDRRRSAVEIRDALPGMYDANGLPTPGYEQAFWMRTRQPVAGGDDEQKAALAYASDFYLLSTIPKALGNSRRIKMMASLDHSMWFYDTFDVSQWMLFIMQTQAAAHGRGVAMGRIYRQDGTLVAVVSQEGLVRGKDEVSEGKPAKL